MHLVFGNVLVDALVAIGSASLWLAILCILFVPLERLFAVQPTQLLRKDVGIDLAYFFLNSVVTAVVMSVPVGALAWLSRSLMPASVFAVTEAWPLWVRAIATMLASELGYYWGHRWSHEIPFLWRFHAIHHSAEHVDFLVSTRAHPVDMVFGRLCGLVPIYVFGLGGPIGPSGSAVTIVVTIVGMLWGFFIHANLKWRFGPLEWLISTPAFHHWHHTLTPINRNYSSTLPWIDWIFGTFYLPSKAFPAQYGIAEKVPSSLLGQLDYPLRPDPVEASTVPAETIATASPDAHPAHETAKPGNEFPAR
jgi:sterol desaturase/sphingolipid hydroxylase (fatty acid hydroxylase superfamily)